MAVIVTVGNCDDSSFTETGDHDMRTLALTQMTPNSISDRSLSTARRRPAAAAVTACVLALTTLTSSVATAQEAAVSPQGKGIVGGALLGAEVGTIVESIAGVHSPWVYVVTDLVLGAGGAVGGWAVEQQVENSGWDVRVPIFMLAGGLGLIIPAVVLTLNGTRYQPSENASEDRAPTNAPAANPGAPGGSIVSPAATPAPLQSPAAAPPSAVPVAPATSPGTGTGGTSSLSPSRARERAHVSLFDVNAEGMHLGVPVPEVRPLFTMSELRQYGLTQQTEVRMPLVKVSF